MCNRMSERLAFVINSFFVRQSMWSFLIVFIVAIRQCCRRELERERAKLVQKRYLFESEFTLLNQIKLKVFSRFEQPQHSPLTEQNCVLLALSSLLLHNRSSWEYWTRFFFMLHRLDICWDTAIFGMCSSSTSPVLCVNEMRKWRKFN